MSKEQEIVKHIKSITKGNGMRHPVADGKTFVAVVKSVVTHACTIDYNGAIFEKVRILSVIDEGNTNVFLLEPKIGSKVLVACMDGNMESLYVVKVQEVQKVHIKQGEMEFEMDTTTGKFELKNSNTSLQQLLTDLVTEILSLKVFTPAGPSGTALPTNVASLNALKTKIKTLLK